MYNFFYINNFFREFDFSIPIFKHPSGYSMTVTVSNYKINEVNIQINFFDEKNQSVSFDNLNEKIIPFFIQAYSIFVSSNKNKTVKDFFRKTRFRLLNTIKNIIKYKEFSFFTVSATSDLPDLFFDKIRTIDKSNNTLFAETRIRGGKMENVFYTDKKNIQLFYLQTISVNMIFNLYKLEKQYLFEIFNNFSSIIKYIIYFGFFLVNVNVYLNTSNPPIWDYMITLISFIGAPIINFLIKRFIFYILKRKIYSFLSKDNKKTKTKVFTIK